jgi:SAM-dependent methyltransferase
VARVPDGSWLRSDYVARLEPAYDADPSTGITWQPDVYADAARVAKSLGSKRIIDVGCGSGSKLAALADRFETIGIDFGPNVTSTRARFPRLEWREHDLMADEALPVTSDEASGAVVICADVIEHLPHPDPLLSKLHAVVGHSAVVLLSTPERELRHGIRHLGPPTNTCHTREWSIRELDELLHHAGFEYRSLGLTRSNDHTEELYTILAAIAPSGDRRDRIVATLIDRSTIPLTRHPLRVRLSRAAAVLLDR